MPDLYAVTGAATGIVGAMTGVTALALQMRAQRQAGRLVTVTTTYGMAVYGDEIGDDDQVMITVHNRGSAPVTVTNFGVQIGKSGSNMFVRNPAPWLTRLPAVVEPGGVPVQVGAPVSELRRAHAEKGVSYKQMRPWVELGDGRRVFANKPVPLA